MKWDSSFSSLRMFRSWTIFQTLTLTMITYRMCAVAVAVLCIAHPGYCFKQMRGDTPKSTVEDTVLLEQKTEYNSSHSTA